MESLRPLKVIPAKIYLRYALLMLPGTVVLVGVLLVVRAHLALPGWFIAVVVSAWLLKDMVLFPFVWQAYDWDRPGISRTMTGSIGIVKTPLTPQGYVQIKGELWKAKNIGPPQTIERGAMVRVVRRNGLMVHVVPGTESEREEN